MSNQKEKTGILYARTAYNSFQGALARDESGTYKTSCTGGKEVAIRRLIYKIHPDCKCILKVNSLGRGAMRRFSNAKNASQWIAFEYTIKKGGGR